MAVDTDALAIEIERLSNDILTMLPCTNRKEDALKANAMKLLGNKIEERELELERRRVEEAVRQHEELYPPTLGECPICLETVRPDIVGTVARFSCCGNYTCMSCRDLGKITKCPLCRAPLPDSKQDNAKATKRLAENGSASAMYDVGAMYEEGIHGLKMDRRKAFEWYRRGAEQGDPNAMCKLGDKLLFGEVGIVTKSIEEGEHWLKTAAEMGHANAQMALGVKYFNGETLAKDPVEGARLITLAVSTDPCCKQNPTAGAAFFLLGQCFFYGKGGLEKSLERAQFYLTKAASLPTFGSAQRKLAQVLIELNNERYAGDILIPGHSCIPQVLNLSRRALENGDTNATAIIDCFETQQRNFCAGCARNAEECFPSTLKSCTRCKAVWYCGKKCQRKDWKDGHKIDCAKIGK